MERERRKRISIPEILVEELDQTRARLGLERTRLIHLLLLHAAPLHVYPDQLRLHASMWRHLTGASRYARVRHEDYLIIRKLVVLHNLPNTPWWVFIYTAWGLWKDRIPSLV